MNKGWNGEYYFNFAEEDGVRSWEDAMKYGFVSAGGGPVYTDPMLKPEIGSRIWVNMPSKGYIGVGIVLETAKPAREIELVVDDNKVHFHDLPLTGHYSKGEPFEVEEYVLPIKWEKTVSLAIQPIADSCGQYCSCYWKSPFSSCRPECF